VKAAYLAALWREMTAWREVETALQEQRSVIIQRQAQAIWASQDRLGELLQQAAACHGEAGGLKPETPDEETEGVIQQARRVRQNVHEALRLNHELLRDLCSYLDMMREVVYPQTLPPTYDHPQRGRSALRGMPGGQTRIA
jgi:hypothetical protein